MKNIILLFLALSASVIASAQTESSKWNVSLGFAEHTLVWNETYAGLNTYGATLGAYRHMNLSQRSAIFSEAGANAQWSHSISRKTFMDTRHKVREDFLSINIPLRFGYDFNPGGKLFHIAPFVGPNFRFNVLGKRVDSQHQNVTGSDAVVSDNYLSRSGECQARVFQIGASAGIALTFSKLTVRYTFVYDLNHYIDGVNFKNNTEMSTYSQLATLSLPLSVFKASKSE